MTWSQKIKTIAQLAGAIEYTDCHAVEGGKPPPNVSYIWPKAIWWWSSSDAGALGNVENPFITIAPRSTISWSGSTW